MRQYRSPNFAKLTFEAGSRHSICMPSHRAQNPLCRDTVCNSSDDLGSMRSEGTLHLLQCLTFSHTGNSIGLQKCAARVCNGQSVLVVNPWLRSVVQGLYWKGLKVEVSPEGRALWDVHWPACRRGGWRAWPSAQRAWRPGSGKTAQTASYLFRTVALQWNFSKHETHRRTSLPPACIPSCACSTAGRDKRFYMTRHS